MNESRDSRSGYPALKYALAARLHIPVPEGSGHRHR